MPGFQDISAGPKGYDHGQVKLFICLVNIALFALRSWDLAVYNACEAYESGWATYSSSDCTCKEKPIAGTYRCSAS